MKKLLLTLIVCWVVGSAFAQQTTFTLQEAVQYALTHDRNIQLGQLDIQDAAAQSKEVLASGLPQLNASIDYNYNAIIPLLVVPASTFGGPEDEFIEEPFGVSNSITGTVSASWLAFSGSYLVAKEGSIEYQKLIELQLEQTKRRIEEEVTNAYVNTLIFDYTRTTLENNIKNLKKLLYETDETYKAGFVEQLDVDRLQLSLQRLENELQSLDNQDKLVKDALKFAMSYPLENEITIADNIDLLLANEFTANLDEQLDLDNRPETAVLNKAIELNELDIERNRKAYLPTVALFVNYQYTFTGNELSSFSNFPGLVMGVQVQAPIFDGFATRARIERAQIAKEVTVEQKMETERALNFQVEIARTNYKNTYERLERIKKNLELTEKIYATVKTKFKEGVGTSFEVIQAESDVYAAQSSYAQALYDYMKAKADFQLALGK